uniref:Fibronectin type-III domain-containing protein n=1 Tax=Globodera rostochiensis TaxID=31243 RepID=A0A914I6N3_GLORO
MIDYLLCLVGGVEGFETGYGELRTDSFWRIAHGGLRTVENCAPAKKEENCALKLRTNPENCAPRCAILLFFLLVRNSPCAILLFFLVVRNSPLSPNTAYRVRIRFIGDLSRSVWSAESEWLRTMESAPDLPPTDVQLHPVDATSIRVKWKPLTREAWNADRVGYRILYRVYRLDFVRSPSSQANGTLAEEIPLSAIEQKESMDVLLKGLKSFESYFVQLCSYNVLGQSALSEPRTIVVGYAVPKQKIHALRVEPISSTSFFIQWDAWEANERDLISGYRLRWTPTKQHSHSEEVDELILIEQNEHTLTELQMWTEYQITVSGYNRAGDGPVSSILARTLDDVPGLVGQIHFRDILLDSVKLSWAVPTEPNGQLTGYVVLYRTLRNNALGTVGIGDLFPRKEVQIRTTRPEASLDGLDDNSVYFVSVRAETAAGTGPEVTANITTGYNNDAPEAPTQIRLVPEQQCVRIRWQNGAPGDTPIKGFLIQTKRIGTSRYDDVHQNGRRLHRSIKPEHLKHVIGHWNTVGLIEGDYGTTEWRLSYRELEPASFYVFRLFARNNLGVGKASVNSEQLHVPASIPDDPFYSQWWFQVVVGALLALVMFSFIVLLFCNNRSKKNDAVANDDDGCRMAQKAKNKKKKNHRRVGEGDAFDTLQLSDGGIVSYELCAKRSERAVGELFTRPTTKQSWVGSLEPSTTRQKRVGGVQQQVPTDIYTALSTDAMPLNSGGGGRASNEPNYASNGMERMASQRQSSSPYFQLRHFNAEYSDDPQISRRPCAVDADCIGDRRSASEGTDRHSNGGGVSSFV